MRILMVLIILCCIINPSFAEPITQELVIYRDVDVQINNTSIIITERDNKKQHKFEIKTFVANFDDYNMREQNLENYAISCDAVAIDLSFMEYENPTVVYNSEKKKLYIGEPYKLKSSYYVK